MNEFVVKNGLISKGNIFVTSSVIATDFTGSLLGTSSWASNSSTSSYFGTGTNNYIPVWSGNTLLSSSAIYQSTASRTGTGSNNIGIGTTASMYPLHVAANVFAGATSTPTDILCLELIQSGSAGNRGDGSGPSLLFRDPSFGHVTYMSRIAAVYDGNSADLTFGVNSSTLVPQNSQDSIRELGRFISNAGTAARGAFCVLTTSSIYSINIGGAPNQYSGSADIGFWVQSTANSSSVTASGRIYGQIDGTDLTTCRITLASPVNTIGTTTDVLSIKNAKVGILTNFPQSALHVFGPVSASSFGSGSLQGTASYSTTSSYISSSAIFDLTTYTLTSSWANNATTASYSLTASYFGTGTNNYIPIWNNNTLTSTSSLYANGDNLGIGWTGSIYPLHIMTRESGSSTFTDVLCLEVSQSSPKVGGSGPTILFKDFPQGPAAFMGRIGAVYAPFQIGGSLTTNLVFYNSSTVNSGDLTDHTIEQMRLDDSGRLLLGTTGSNATVPIHSIYAPSGSLVLGLLRLPSVGITNNSIWIGGNYFGSGSVTASLGFSGNLKGTADTASYISSSKTFDTSVYNLTASLASNSTSASYALSASFSISSSWSQTSSNYATLATTQSNFSTQSLFCTQSVNATSSISASFATTASYAFSASYLVDRGDPSANDFTLANLTTDGTWHDLILSGSVPAGARFVLINADVQDNAVSSEFYFRKKGNSNPFNLIGIRTQVPNLSIRFDGLVAMDTNRTIQYFATNKVWSGGIGIVIRGWMF